MRRAKRRRGPLASTMLDGDDAANRGIAPAHGSIGLPARLAQPASDGGADGRSNMRASWEIGS
jgi:hypothetical protein